MPNTSGLIEQPIVSFATAPAIATAPQATAPQATTTTFAANQRAVDPGKETVAGQMKGLIQENSPYMQMARSSADQQMNDRGLRNSSLAVTASDAAAYQAAMPIATADASVYDTNAKQNLAYLNDASKTNATATNDIAGRNLAASTDIAGKNLSASTDVAIKNLSTATEAMKSNMDTNMKMQLATIEADYKTVMQNSATASEMYKQTVKNISDIQANKDMSLKAKQAAVDNQYYLLKQGFQIAGAIGNMNLGNLLNFSAAPKAVE